MKILAILAVLMTSLSFAQGGDADRGALIYARKKDKKLGKTKPANCVQCHGKDGMGKAKKKDGEWKLNMMKGARIAGLPEAYIYEQLKAVQSKKRKTKNTGTMYMRIKKYDDQDLKDLAAYVSKKLNPKAGEYKSEIWPREE